MGGSKVRAMLKSLYIFLLIGVLSGPAGAAAYLAVAPMGYR